MTPRAAGRLGRTVLAGAAPVHGEQDPEARWPGSSRASAPGPGSAGQPSGTPENLRDSMGSPYRTGRYAPSGAYDQLILKDAPIGVDPVLIRYRRAGGVNHAR